MIDLKALRLLGVSSPLNIQPARNPDKPLPVRSQPVSFSRELERICALPRHLGYSDAEREAIESVLRRPGGSMRLWPHQADALLAALDAGGLFAPLCVGAGKTLLAFLLPTVLEAARAVVLTTAALALQMKKMREMYEEHWHIRNDMVIESYARLSHAKHADILKRLQPELIVADEAHALRDPKSARTRRFKRHFREFPETKFAALSGTLCKRSLIDYAHLTELSLGEGTPLPRDYPTLKEWAECLDPGGFRPAGALTRLCAPGEEAVAGYARRLRETQGVSSSPPESVGSTLILKRVEGPASVLIDKARRAVQKTWERPDGEELTEAMEVAALDRQLRLGGFYGWAYPPAVEWLRARRDWNKAMREWLRGRAREGCDSPGLLTVAVRGGLEGGSMRELLLAWESAAARYPEPPRVWTWIDRSVAAWAGEWAKANVGIVFADLVHPARLVAELGGHPYYGEGSKAAMGVLGESGSRSIVCSLQAHGQGRNFQMFDRALVFSAPPTGTVWEQMIGRLHRSGQLADEVEFSVLDSFWPELQRATDDARYIAASTSMQQKLLIASVLT